MRATTIIAVLMLCFTFAHCGISVWKWLGVNNNIDQAYNYECMVRDIFTNQLSCMGPTAFNYTIEESDNVRTWYCGWDYSNITILMYQSVYWPGLFVYDGTGDPAKGCFRVGIEGEGTLSIYQGGLFFWKTTDYKSSNCWTGSTSTFEIRSLITFPFNVRSLDTMSCLSTTVIKTYTGAEIGELRTQSKRIAFRNFRGNITLANSGRTHVWNDMIPEATMELGSWPGFEPVFNIYGYFLKQGAYRTKTVLSSSANTIKMTWHYNSTVHLTTPWTIYDMRPQTGPNSMNGLVIINNTNLQIEGNWVVNPSAVVTGSPTGFNNFTYVASSPLLNTITLGGTFNYITFFGNSSNINYLTTGTFSNCNAILTDRATGWTWNRQGADDVATFNSVTLGVNNPIVLTLRDGAFAFNSLSGPGSIQLVNAVLTVAGQTFSGAVVNLGSTLRLTTTSTYTLAAPVSGNGSLQFATGDHIINSASSAALSSLTVASGASLVFPASTPSLTISSSFINRGTTYFTGRNTIAAFSRGISFTQTSTGNTVLDFDYTLLDLTGRFDTLAFSGGT
jgi:hypothetical protein